MKFKDNITPEFIDAIPKTDLHLHLDGSLRIPTLIELSKKGGFELPAWDEEGLKATVYKETYKDLPDYLHGFKYTGFIMRDAGNLKRIAKELAEDNIAENVRYMEVRFAPQLHVTRELDIYTVIRSIAQGIQEAKDAHNSSAAVKEGKDIEFNFGLIVCAMRRFSAGFAPYYADLMHVLAHAPGREVYSTASLELARIAVDLIRKENLPIVGFDLAGEEAGYPAVYHKKAYEYAHSNFLRKTVHAGEAYGPESIFQAITECHANRIGHGTFLFSADKIADPEITNPKMYIDELANYIASQRIGIEVCVTSNLQTNPTIKSAKDHPVRKMIDYGLSVSICTDNRLMSRTSVSKELKVVAQAAELNKAHLKNIVVAGFKGAFFHGSYNEKRAFVRKAINRYEELERQMLK